MITEDTRSTALRMHHQYILMGLRYKEFEEILEVKERVQEKLKVRNRELEILMNQTEMEKQDILCQAVARDIKVKE